MSRLIIVPPQTNVEEIRISRGTGRDNLVTADPKEAWIDATDGSEATIEISLTRAVPIDTVLLAYVRPPAAAATWSATGGPLNWDDYVMQPAGPLRVPDVAGDAPTTSHAFWTGPTRDLRYLRVRVAQPAGAGPLSIGRVVIGQCFRAELGHEWGAGRRPIDTGSATPLPSGGFAIVEGVRKRQFTWTFGDLSVEEADRLDRIAEAHGETAPVVVVEDPDRTAGLRSRIHYGLFNRWSAFERRNRRQTRWEIGVEEWR